MTKKRQSPAVQQGPGTESTVIGEFDGAATLAGEPIPARLTRAPGNDAPIGGLKVISANGWFAARPSGTENIYKIYAESFKDEQHLQLILTEARQIVNNALAGSNTNPAIHHAGA